MGALSPGSKRVGENYTPTIYTRYAHWEWTCTIDSGHDSVTTVQNKFGVVLQH